MNNLDKEIKKTQKRIERLNRIKDGETFIDKIAPHGELISIIGFWYAFLGLVICQYTSVHAFLPLLVSGSATCLFGIGLQAYLAIGRKYKYKKRAKCDKLIEKEEEKLKELGFEEEQEKVEELGYQTKKNNSDLSNSFMFITSRLKIWELLLEKHLEKQPTTTEEGFSEKVSDAMLKKFVVKRLNPDLENCNLVRKKCMLSAKQEELKKGKITGRAKIRCGFNFASDSNDLSL